MGQGRRRLSPNASLSGRLIPGRSSSQLLYLAHYTTNCGRCQDRDKKWQSAAGKAFTVGAIGVFPHGNSLLVFCVAPESRFALPCRDPAAVDIALYMSIPAGSCPTGDFSGLPAGIAALSLIQGILPAQCRHGFQHRLAGTGKVPGGLANAVGNGGHILLL